LKISARVEGTSNLARLETVRFVDRMIEEIARELQAAAALDQPIDHNAVLQRVLRRFRS
jgi:hypothetical protein